MAGSHQTNQSWRKSFFPFLNFIFKKNNEFKIGRTVTVDGSGAQHQQQAATATDHGRRDARYGVHILFWR